MLRRCLAIREVQLRAAELQAAICASELRSAGVRLTDADDELARVAGGWQRATLDQGPCSASTGLWSAALRRQDAAVDHLRKELSDAQDASDHARHAFGSAQLAQTLAASAVRSECRRQSRRHEKRRFAMQRMERDAKLHEPGYYLTGPKRAARAARAHCEQRC